MKYGIRAVAKLINNFMTRYGLVNVFDIINRWAPDHESPTNVYADTVAARMGVERALVMEGSRLAGVV